MQPFYLTGAPRAWFRERVSKRSMPRLSQNFPKMRVHVFRYHQQLSCRSIVRNLQGKRVDSKTEIPGYSLGHLSPKNMVYSYQNTTLYACFCKSQTQQGYFVRDTSKKHTSVQPWFGNNISGLVTSKRKGWSRWKAGQLVAFPHISYVWVLG